MNVQIELHSPVLQFIRLPEPWCQVLLRSSDSQKHSTTVHQTTRTTGLQYFSGQQVVRTTVDQSPSFLQIIRQSAAQYCSLSAYQIPRTMVPWYFSDHQIVRSPVQQFVSLSDHQKHRSPILVRSAAGQNISGPILQLLGSHSNPVQQCIRLPESKYPDTSQIIR